MRIIYKIFCCFLVYILTIFLMKTHDRKFWLISIRNSKYFLWLYKRDFETPKFYKIKILLFVLFFLLLFPFLSIIVSDWERFILFNGELTSIPIALQKDNRNYEVTKKMQSKLEWYYTFTRYNINTPKVFYNGKTLLNPISPDIETFIKKPIYGTEGSKVSKINKRDLNSAFEESYIIQEYISDCFTDFARHIRIMTYCDNANKCHVFFIKEDRQSTDSITSNRSNKGTIQTICKNNFCDFLSRKEQRQITHVSKKIVKTTPKRVQYCTIYWMGCIFII